MRDQGYNYAFHGREARDRGRFMVNDLKSALARLWAREEGLTTVEYAIAGTLIVLALIVAFTALGNAVSAQITAITGWL